jgi:hypothetical protein
MLTDYEKTQAASVVQRLILASGQEGRLLRVLAGERLFGSDEAPFMEICTLPLELVPTPPTDLTGKIDATASVLPDADVRAEDRLEISNVMFRIQTVTQENLFGIVTHQRLELVRLHGR